MKKILIVDDSILIRAYLTKIFEGVGFSVVGEASDGESAVKMYKLYQPDLITMDIIMSKMDGIEALKQIRSINSNANVVMFTSMEQSYYKDEAFQNGARAFIVKPFTRRTILEMLDVVFSQS